MRKIKTILEFEKKKMKIHAIELLKNHLMLQTTLT